MTAIKHLLGGRNPSTVLTVTVGGVWPPQRKESTVKNDRSIGDEYRS